ncbi:MAG: glycosyltransferase family 1 protein [Bacteroidota bacterium]|nr:glycosyltransferase family 1 protein [Bacteroidota bacterium]
MNKKDIKIAYFAGAMKKGLDGVTRVLYRLTDYLNENEIDSIFFSAIIPPKEEQPVPMYEVPSIAFPLYKDYKLALPGYAFFEKNMKEFKPDIIHINSPCSLGSAAVKYGNRHNIPVVATYHTHFASYAKYYNIGMLENFSRNYLKKLYNRCEQVYVPSKPILKELSELGLENLMYLPHGVDTKMFSPNHKSDLWKKELNIEGKVVLLYAGRLVWEKDLKTLAGTYKIISQKYPEAVFALAGDGPVKKDLEKLMPDALFLGYQSSENLARIYASSDIFVFPSTTETFGNVTLEAMASGIPPVCVREGGAYGMIKEGITGLIANPKDEADLALKLGLLIENEKLRKSIGLNGLTYAHKQSWDNIFDSLFSNYKKIINNYNIIHIKSAA